MKKIVLLLFVSAYILNGCHSNTNSINSTAPATLPVTDTAKIHAITPQPADTSIKDGVVIKKYSNGVIKERSNYVGGRRQGECQSFYPNGKLESDDYFTGGVLDGSTITYFDNGQKRYEGACTKGKKTGVWKFYDNTGKVVRSVDYSKQQDKPLM